MPILNPWLLLGALSAILVSFIGGVSVGKDLERAEWLERDRQHQAATEAETARANEIAVMYGTALNSANDVATALRRKMNEQRAHLSECQPSGDVVLNDTFVRVYNAALQSGSGDAGEPAGASGGAGTTPDRVLDTHIENGRRWRACRDQLNAVIDAYEGQK